VKRAFESDAKLFSQVFRQFDETLEQASGPHFDELFREFYAAFKESRMRRVGSTPHLDVLKVFGVIADELRHSRVLSWFLDMDAEHEQGAIFTQALLRLITGKEIPELIQAAGKEDYIVEREKHERTDVSVYGRRRFAIFIENKVRASERTDQVKDMINSLVRLADAQQIPISCRFAVFLTDDGRDPQTGPSNDIAFDPCNLKALSRVEVFNAFDQALSDRTASQLLINLLCCYRNAIEQLRRL